MKTLRSKLTVVFAFFAVVALAFGIGFMPKQASAAVDTSTGFYIEDGASIRTEVGESGIKWTAHISETKYAELNTEANSVVAIGIAIQPQGNTNEDLDIHYVYGSESYQINFTDGAFEYSYAIFYDDLIADIEKIMGDLDTDAEKEYLLKAYQTILEARPFVKHADGTYTYGEYFDTARSLQGVAVGNLVAGTYAEGSPEDTLLKSYLPNGYELVDTEYVADSYYSNYDAWGNIAINSNIPMANARVYYGANDVTSAYNKDTGILALTEANKVETKITTDGKANDFVTIYDELTGNVYKQSFVGVTLAIDKAEDFKYFQAKKPIDYDKSNSNTDVRFAEGDVEFDGYYVLLNNIDCSGYLHDFVNGTILNLTSSHSWDNCKNYLVGKGLTGIFDGRGFTISDLAFTTTSTRVENGFTSNIAGVGLFGYINGGTVKNVGFYNPQPRAVDGLGNVNLGSTGFLADRIWNESIIENCYFYLEQNISQSGQRWFPTTEADTIMKNCFVHIGRTAVNAQYNARATSPVFSGYTGMTDTYVIFDSYLEIGGRLSSPEKAVLLTGTETTLQPVKVIADAGYVDGVANVATSNKFWAPTRYDSLYGWDKYSLITYDGVEYTKDSTYGINLMPGLQRYTSLAKMNPENNENAINNDFSAWNPDVWTIVDGVPTFKSVENVNYTYLADGAQITDEGVGIEAEKSFDVTVALDGVDTGIKPQLEVISVDGADDILSVAGNKVTALAEGSQAVKVIYGSSEYVFTVNVMAPPVDLETEYNFSAHDGIFFDNNFNVVSLVDALINFAQVDSINILSAKDSNDNALTVSETNAILGLDLGKQTTWKETSFTVYTDAGAFRVHFNAADLILDELDDFRNYFTVTTKPTVKDNNITFADGEAEWDGYYIMVKNLVGAGNSSNNTAHSVNMGFTVDSIKADDIEDQAKAGTTNGVMTNGVYTKGLTGVFDGNGYKIDGVKMSTGGLFGLILGGTVKNLFVTSCGWQSDSMVARIIAGDAKIENCYFNFTRTSGAYWEFSPLAPNIGNGVTLSNVYIKTANSITTSYPLRYGGSLGYMAEAGQTINNVFVVSPLALSYANSYTTVAYDAQYIDGENTLELETPPTYTVIEGIKRYSAVANMTTAEEVEKNAEALAAFVATGYFKNTNGELGWITKS